MAKFKRGDVVSWVSPITKKKFNGVIREVATGHDEPSYRVAVAGYNGFPVVPEKWLIKNGVQNSRAMNSKFKVGDKVKHKPTGLSGVVVKRNDWERGVEAYDVKSPQTRDIMQWEADDLVALNSCVCNSTNPVVLKAMNAVARNAGDNQGLWTEKEVSYAKSILGYFSPRITARGFMVGDSPTRGWFEIKKNGSGYNIQGDSYSLNPDDGSRFNRSESNFEKAVLFIFHTLKQR